MLLLRCILILVSILQCAIEDLSSSKGKDLFFTDWREASFYIIFPSYRNCCIWYERYCCLQTLSFTLATDTVFTKNLLTLVAFLRDCQLLKDILVLSRETVLEMGALLSTICNFALSQQWGIEYSHCLFLHFLSV